MESSILSAKSRERTRARDLLLTFIVDASFNVVDGQGPAGAGYFANTLLLHGRLLLIRSIVKRGNFSPKIIISYPKTSVKISIRIF